MSSSDTSGTELSGVQKVAVVLMQLDPESAAEVLRQFTEFEADEITAEIVKMRRVDSHVVDATIDEIHHLASSGSTGTRGGREVAAGLLELTYGAEKATTVMGRVNSTMAGRTFEFLDGTDPAHIGSLLDGELPQTIALVLGHLAPETASAVLAGLNPQLRNDTATALATIGTPVPEAVRVVSEELKKRTGTVITAQEPVEQVGGIRSLVDILNHSDVAMEKDLLNSMDSRDPKLAELLRSQLLSFSDLIKFERRDVQRVLRGVEAATLAYALRGAEPELEELIRANISDRTAEIMDAEVATMGRVRLSQVEEARASVVQSIRVLEASGEITIKRGDEDDYV